MSVAPNIWPRYSFVQDSSTDGAADCYPDPKLCLPLSSWRNLACQVQVDVMAAGQEICFPSAEAQDTTETLLGRQADGLAVSVGGTMEWEAMVRELDREDPSYAQ